MAQRLAFCAQAIPVGAMSFFALIHPLCLDWGRPRSFSLFIRHVSDLGRIFGQLKRSGAPKTTLRLAIDHFRRAPRQEPAIAPPQFIESREIAALSPLSNIYNADTWLAERNALVNRRIPDASRLAPVSILGIRTIAQSSPVGDLITPILQAARIERSQEQGIDAPVVAFRANLNAIPEALGHSVELSEFGTEYDESKWATRHASDFENLPTIGADNCSPRRNSGFATFTAFPVSMCTGEYPTESAPHFSISGIWRFFLFRSLLDTAHRPFPGR